MARPSSLLWRDRNAELAHGSALRHRNSALSLASLSPGLRKTLTKLSFCPPQLVPQQEAEGNGGKKKKNQGTDSAQHKADLQLVKSKRCSTAVLEQTPVAQQANQGPSHAGYGTAASHTDSGPNCGLLTLLPTGFTKISFFPRTENHCDVVLSILLTSLEYHQFD